MADSVLKRAYGVLPAAVHDHPGDFLRRYFTGWKQVRFIQIGAHDGIAGDPIRPNVLANAAWSGVLIEPNPVLFERLQANYAGRAGLKFKCAAVSDSSGILPLYVFSAHDQQDSVPSWWSEISSLDRDHLARALPRELHARIGAVDVPVLTLREVFVEAGLADVNLIAMDVEGHEQTILEDILRCEIRPDVLVFEHKHMAETDFRRLVTQFQRHGYLVKMYGRDTILYRALDNGW